MPAPWHENRNNVLSIGRRSVVSFFKQWVPKSIIAVVALIVVFSFSAAEAAEKPNVLFISIDDMNHWISCMREYQEIYDYPAYNTPNIDKLMKRGVFFTNAHVPASSCRPSRVSTFTGLNVVAHGVYRNPHEWLISPVLKGRDDISLMQRFRKEGYWVAGGGKNFHHVHLESWDEYHGKNAPKLPAEQDAKYRALQKQFSAEMELMYKRREEDKGDAKARANAKVNGQDKSNAVVWGAIDAPDEAMPDTMMVDYMIRQLNKVHDKPFYLGVGFHKPHMPWSVPRKYFDMYPLEHTNLINNPKYATVIRELKAHIPAEQAEEVVQVAKVVIQVQTKLLNRKKKITGPTYNDAQKRVYQAVLDCAAGEEEAVARALATEIFTKAIADGVYDPENLEKPGGAFASGKADILVEKKKTNAKPKPEKTSKAN